MLTSHNPSHSSVLNAAAKDAQSDIKQSDLSSMQWRGLQEVCDAEAKGREAVIADGVRDSLVNLGLILPDMYRQHRITEKAKGLLLKAAPESH